MPGNDLRFYGTTGTDGTADGDSQPDRSLWLGRFRASQTLHEFQSTVTTAQTDRDRHILVDSARIGDGADAHALKWLLVQTGPAALSAARVASFDTATGTFVLDRRTTANAAIGDDYAIFDGENVFPDVTAAQCVSGDTRFRCIVARNEHGVAVTNVKHHFQTLALGDVLFDRINNVVSGQPFLQRSDDTTDVLNSLGQRDLLGGPDNFSLSGQWNHPFRGAEAFEIDASLANNFGNAIWLRRVVPAGCKLRRSVAMMVVVTTDVTGSDPDPLVGAAIIAFDITGLTPQASLVPDRFVHAGGGARLSAAVTDTTTQAPVPDQPVQFQMKAGDAGTVATDDDPVAPYATTDDDGLAGATYAAPADPTVAAQLTGNPVLTFDQIGAADDELLRDAGSWSADGFSAGDKIEVRNTQLNDGLLTIKAIVTTTIPDDTLTFESDVLIDETVILTTNKTVRGQVAEIELLVGVGEEIGDPHGFSEQTQSIDLDGSTEILKSSASTIGISDSWSIEAWVRRKDADTVARRLVHIREAATANNEIFVFREAGVSTRLRAFCRDSVGVIFKDGRIDGQLGADAWVQVVITYNGAIAGDRFLMYVDGVDITPTLLTDNTGTMIDTSRRIAFGGNVANIEFWFGNLLSLVIWDVELTAAEVLTSYNGGKGGQFDLNRDQGAYVSRQRLRHWFRTGHEAAPSLGNDFARDPAKPIHDLDDEAADITDADRVSEVP